LRRGAGRIWRADAAAADKCREDGYEGATTAVRAALAKGAVRAWGGKREPGSWGL
jgi:hypothetical protein